MNTYKDRIKDGIKIILIGIAMATAFQSCQKAQVINKAETFAIRANAINTDKVLDLRNPLNPFDSVGYLHNVILDSISNCMPDSSTDLKVLTTCVVRISSEMSIPIPKISADSIAVMIQNAKDGSFGTINTLPYSAHCRELANKLIVLIEDDSSVKNITYDTVWKDISDFEKTISTDQQLTNTERTTLLMAASVGRYSAWHWMSRPELQATWIKNILKWGAAVAGDVTGILATGNFESAAEGSYLMYCLVYFYMN